MTFEFKPWIIADKITFKCTEYNRATGLTDDRVFQEAFDPKYQANEIIIVSVDSPDSPLVNDINCPKGDLSKLPTTLRSGY